MKNNDNVNSFNNTINFNGPTQIAGRDIINNSSGDEKATYEAEPKWRSPFTLAVLSWMGLIIGIVGLLPIGKIVKYILDSFSKRNFNKLSDLSIMIYAVSFVLLFLLFTIIVLLRRIAKNQTRHPLFFNYAISGYGNRLTLEKIHTSNCPKCGGKMKYYNKPEYREIIYSDGSTKSEIIRKIPVLECERNKEHYYVVDPAEDKIN